MPYLHVCDAGVVAGLHFAAYDWACVSLRAMNAHHHIAAASTGQSTQGIMSRGCRWCSASPLSLNPSLPSLIVITTITPATDVHNAARANDNMLASVVNRYFRIYVSRRAMMRVAI